MRTFERSRINAIGYILVGGASSRFGRDKALVRFADVSMIERMKALLTGIYMPQIYLVGDPAKYSSFGVPCVADRWPGEGPLGGILTALLHTEREPIEGVALLQTKEMAQPRSNIILGCDMPFLNKEWMEEFLVRALQSDADVIVPCSDSGLEPMCACWRTKARPVIEAQFDRGVRKVADTFKHLKTEVLDESVWKRFDKNGRLFWNMNTPDDFEEARRILDSHQS